MELVLMSVQGIASIVGFVCFIIVLIHAFQNSLAQGFLSLCIPFYVFYYLFALYTSPHRKTVITVWLVALGIYIVCMSAMMAMAGAA